MIIEKSGVKYFVFKNLEAAGVRHLFSTRVGGVSEGAYASLNLGVTTGDCLVAIRKNFIRICDVAGFDVDGIVMSQQVHGTNIFSVESTKSVEKSVDGLVTDKAGIVLTTYYADCVPLLFYDPIKKVAGNAHAGWRGVAADMAGRMVAAMEGRHGSHPNDILVGIGPSISVKNFEVGAEVEDEFKKSLPFSEKFIYNSEGARDKYYVDLWEICRLSLIRAGVKPNNIEVAGICTYANPELFYSHRRDGLPRGGMAAMICL